MKKTIKSAFVLIALAAFVSCSEQEVEIDVPEIVAASFAERFSGATDVEWEMEGENYEAEFSTNENEYEALFSPDGEMLELEVELDLKMIPPQMTAYIDEKYNKAEIIEAAKVMNGDGNFYLFEIETSSGEMELWFDSNGEFIKDKKEVEGEEADDK